MDTTHLAGMGKRFEIRLRQMQGLISILKKIYTTLATPGRMD